MRLAIKFTLAFLTAILVVHALYAYGVAQREIELFESDMQGDQSTLSHSLGLAVRDIWRKEGEAAARQFINDANQDENQLHIDWMMVNDISKESDTLSIPETAVRELKQGKVSSWIDPHAGTEGFRYTCTPFMVEGRGLGTLIIGKSLEQQRAYTSTTIRNIVLASLAVAVISGALNMLLGMRFIGRPVSQLIRQVRDVAAGKLEGRIHLRQHDELLDLGIELNTMCDQLISARARLAAETAARIATIEQLRHADRLTTVGQLASGVAHELGTPLNVVRARAKTISQDASIPDPTAASAGIIVSQADRMTGIIRQLLDFARPRAPRRSLTDLRQVVERTILLLQAMAHKASVEIQMETGERPILVRVDPDQIQQVLTNLIMNGVQAMHAGGQLSIAVHTVEAQPPADIGGPVSEFAAVAVRDQGEGIAPENLHRLFEPFFTTKQVGEGTGLGLSVSRGIIQEHQGWIGVESRPGEGSVFTVHLPMGTRDAAARPDCR